jgi:hypothetical protein
VIVAGDDGLWSDEEDSGAHLESNWSSGYAWATWQASFRPGLRAETLVSAGHLGRDRMGNLAKPDDGVFTPLLGTVRDLASYDFAGIRQDWQATLSEDLVLKTGFDLRYGSADYDYASSATWHFLDENGRIGTREDRSRVETSPTGYEGGGYLSARTRWGSCTSGGSIRLNWRLIKAPPSVIDYVVIHELAHLVELNHSPSFWQIVAQLCPDYAEQRALLKEQAAHYHRF